MSTETCPRCGLIPYAPNLMSLFYPNIQICRLCADVEIAFPRARWLRHPDIAEFEQTKGVPFESVRTGHKFATVNKYFLTERA